MGRQIDKVVKQAKRSVRSAVQRLKELHRPDADIAFRSEVGLRTCEQGQWGGSANLPRFGQGMRQSISEEGIT